MDMGSYWQLPVRKQLLRLALITAPLLTIFRLAPVVVISQDQLLNLFKNDANPLQLLAIAGTFLTTSILIMWLTNIWLFTRELDSDSTPITATKRIQPYLWSFFIAFSMLIVPITLDHLLVEPLPFKRNDEVEYFFPFLGILANNAVILLIINLVLTRVSESRLSMTNMQLEVNHLMAQQAQLKHQLQPHFLFNALYTLQLLIGKEPDQAKDYLQRLSGFLRTSVQHARRNTATINEELKFCEDYLSLQKVRFGDGLQLEISSSELQEMPGELPIFTLQMLAENAIKHNAFDAEQPLRIRIVPTDDGQILVENNVRPKTYAAESDKGFGLPNLTERFRLLSQQEPRIVSLEMDQLFRVYVPILST